MSQSSQHCNEYHPKQWSRAFVTMKMAMGCYCWFNKLAQLLVEQVASICRDREFVLIIPKNRLNVLVVTWTLASRHHYQLIELTWVMNDRATSWLSFWGESPLIMKSRWVQSIRQTWPSLIVAYTIGRAYVVRYYGPRDARRRQCA